jgi:WD40 repeat protein
VAISPDMQLVAVAGSHEIWLWDATSGKIIQTVYASALNSTERGAVSLAWSPDGKQLAAGGLHGVVMVWRLDIVGTGVGKELRPGPLRLEPEEDAADFGADVQVAFSPDGSYLGAMDDNGNFVAWDSQVFRLRAKFNSQYAGYFAWSPDSKRIADEFLDVGYLENNTILGADYDASINSTQPYNVAWSPDGKQIAVSCADYDILLAAAPDPTTKVSINKLNQTVAAPLNPNAASYSKLRPLAWSPDNRWVAVANVPVAGKVTFWQANNLKIALTINVSSRELSSLQWPSSTLLITGAMDGLVKFWQLK